MGAKNAAICRLLQRFLGLSLYIGSIAAFFGIAAIGIVFCSVLQWQDKKSPPYISFRGDNVDIAGAPETRHNK